MKILIILRVKVVIIRLCVVVVGDLTKEEIMPRLQFLNKWERSDVSINKNQLSTQVLVNNGQTIVLGGVFQSQDVERIDKTPFLGDLPYIGKLFSRTTTSTEKNELLIFITPKLVEELLAGS